ncbi:FGGY family carbohydrate kinase [Promicromonospora sukumoe]
MSDIVVAIDQGTTNTKALAVDAAGVPLATASVPVGVSNPRPGWVEQDADELWASVRGALLDCLAQVPGATPRGIALSTQRESVVAWDRRDGRPLGPVLSWQDTRTAGRCGALAADPRSRAVTPRTGLPLDPMFSAPKMAWALEHHGSGPHVALGTVDSWLLWNLVGEHLNEAGNASRTLLLDLERLGWDPELAGLFGVPLSALGRVVRSDGPFGVVTAPGLPAVPVLAVLADSHAALLGHGPADPATVKATYGTGSSVMRVWPTADVVGTGVATTLAWLTDRPTYALEGNIRYSGAALDWTARLLGVDGGAALGELAGTVEDAAGTVLVPAFGGLGAPHWEPGAVGVLTGMTAGTTRAHVARAAFDAVVMQVADVVAATTPPGAEAPKTLYADGGASSSDLLMRLQADALGCEVRPAATAELSALGAARLAARGLGWPEPVPPASDAAPARRYSPTTTPAGRERRRARWHAALDRSRGRDIRPLTLNSTTNGDDR